MATPSPAASRPAALAIIPAYNEAETVADVVRGVKAQGVARAVLVVDDGSEDATVSAASSEGAVVVSLPFNLGYGAALQTGYRYALTHGYEYAVQLDADGQHDPASIPALLAAAESGWADVVVGSRFLGEGAYKPPLPRALGMRIFARIASSITGQKITDPTSGFQALNARTMQLFAEGDFPSDFPDADVLVMLHRLGYRIAEVPVVMHPGAAHKSMHRGLRPVYYIFKMLLSLLVTVLGRGSGSEGGR